VCPVGFCLAFVWLLFGFYTYSAQQLAPMESLLSTKSDYIFNTVGVYGVAESAALLAAQINTGTEPELILNKIKNAKATCALARGFCTADN
jgi:cobalt-precorrin 5A hydrolase